MERKQFTFYRSYYEAVKDLNKRDQTAVLLAVCDYALNETEPNLTGAAKAIFTLIKPILDTSRRKAEGGMGRSKDEDGGKNTESKGNRKVAKPDRNPRAQTAQVGWFLLHNILTQKGSAPLWGRP